MNNLVIIRPIESHSGTRRNIRSGILNILAGLSGKKQLLKFFKWYILVYFIFLSDSGAPQTSRDLG